MKRTCILILFFILNNFESFSQDLILSPNHSSTLAVILNNEHSFIEYFVIDKPIKYVKFDTLQEVESGQFFGIKSELKQIGNEYYLTIKDSLINYENKKLHQITKKQLNRRIERHNTYLYNLNVDRVKAIREKLRLSGEINKMNDMDNKWKNLFYKRSKLDILSYRNRIDQFSKEFGFAILKN